MATAIIIPARLNSTRLPEKIMADIAGQPMLFHVAERAIAANVGPVLIACDNFDVYKRANHAGFTCLMTSQEHTNGTERINEALGYMDADQQFQTIINVQADVPVIEPTTIRALDAMMDEVNCDIGTICALDMDRKKMASHDIVKLIGSPNIRRRTVRALYFTRALPWIHSPIYHHIGVYAYRRAALNRLRHLPVGTLECAESLEQLRALENGMWIEAMLVNRATPSVDTQADLDAVRELFNKGAS